MAVSIQRMGILGMSGDRGEMVGMPWHVPGAMSGGEVVRPGQAASLTMTGLKVGAGNRELRSRHTGEGARVHIILSSVQLA